jgi:hypothetical protein
MQRAEFLPGGSDGFAELGPIGGIGCEESPVQIGGEPRALLCVDIRDGDLPAALDKPPRRGRAQSRRAAGNEENVTGYLHGPISAV